MEEYVYIDGKKYRRGYTTGSCATAASKAATYMLLTKKKIKTINIDTPKGIPLTLDVQNISLNNDYVECSIKKDGGDDIDATHTMDIYAKAEIIDRENGEDIIVCGGYGIGVVTKKGLSVEVGKAAINPTPMKMINYEIRKVIGEDISATLGEGKSLKITISAPIVEPMSDEGWKKSLSIELKMKKEQGLDKIILVPGNHGEQFIREKLNLDMKYVVRTSNFIGYMLKEAQRMEYKKILMAGHIGKFIKLSAGIFNTHSKVADARSEILISNLALMKAPYDLLEKINECLTAEEAVEVINENNYTEFYDKVSNKCRYKVKQYLGDDDTEVEVIMFSMDKTLLGKSDNTDSLVEVFR